MRGKRFEVYAGGGAEVIGGRKGVRFLKKAFGRLFILLGY